MTRADAIALCRKHVPVEAIPEDDDDATMFIPHDWVIALVQEAYAQGQRYEENFWADYETPIDPDDPVDPDEG